MTPRSITVLQVAAALIVGALLSTARLAYICRDPISEQCVWGKAFRSISLPLETIAIGLVAFLIIRAVGRRRGSR